ncbi:unnamed protein product [Colias eurytheme]|nr:unnamed protein product [Colias eurytheme]
MRACLFLLAIVGACSANILRHQFYPQMDLVFQPLDTELQFKRPAVDSQERYIYEDNSDYPAPRVVSKEFSSPFFSKVIREEIPKYGDSVAWKGIHIAVGPKSPVNNKNDIERIFSDAYRTLQHITEEDKQKFHQTYETAIHAEGDHEHLNATQLLQKNKYQVEEHTVQTDDGYILTMIRVLPREETTVLKRPVVFLMHGLLGSADDWLLMGPGKSLAYMLVDAGFEVWLGNSRGSRYSRRHVSKHPAQADFWKFSIDEIAQHDLPAMIDYVLRTSEEDKVFYVGHSQGTTAFFALASTRPEYRRKIAMMYALAPMVYMTNARSPFVRMIAPNSPFFETLQKQLGYGEFRLPKELIHTIGGDMCEKQVGCKYLCSNVNFVVSGLNPLNMDVDLIHEILSHLPAGASTRQMKHYGQALSSDEFRKYDYGIDTNTAVYGTAAPPKYNMTEVKVPVAIYWSEDDWLAHPMDVERLHRELPDVRDYYKVPEEHFTHMDFQFSRRAPVVINQRLVESIKNHF